MSATLKTGGTPDQKLTTIMKGAVSTILAEMEASKSAPTDFFIGSTVLLSLIDKLGESFHGASAGNTEYPVLAQLIALETETIGKCLNSGCHAKANQMLAQIQQNGSVANGGAPALRAAA